MKVCECCGKEFDEKTLGKYSTGRFCSKSCANTRKHSAETRKKISKNTRAAMQKINGSFAETGRHIIRKPKRFYSWVWFKCEQCSFPILEYTNKAAPHSKFCSDSCKKQYLAELARKQINRGLGNYGSYKGFRCDSLLELSFLIFCLDHQIPIERCEESFSYTFKGKDHRYNPDFKIGSRYIEIKGWTSQQADAKIDAVREAGKQISVLYEKDLHKCIAYVCSKYNVTKANLKCLYDAKEYTRICTVCGKSFISQNPNQIACSRECNGRSNKSRIWISNGSELKHVMPENLEPLLSNGWYRVKPLGPNRGFAKIDPR